MQASSPQAAQAISARPVIARSTDTLAPAVDALPNFAEALTQAFAPASTAPVTTPLPAAPSVQPATDPQDPETPAAAGPGPQSKPGPADGGAHSDIATHPEVSAPSAQPGLTDGTARPGSARPKSAFVAAKPAVLPDSAPIIAPMDGPSSQPATAEPDSTSASATEQTPRPASLEANVLAAGAAAPPATERPKASPAKDGPGDGTAPSTHSPKHSQAASQQTTGVDPDVAVPLPAPAVPQHDVVGEPIPQPLQTEAASAARPDAKAAKPIQSAVQPFGEDADSTPALPATPGPGRTPPAIQTTASPTDAAAAKTPVHGDPASNRAVAEQTAVQPGLPVPESSANEASPAIQLLAPFAHTTEPPPAAAPSLSTAQAHLPAPATQLAPAIVTLGAAPPGAAPGVGRQVTIRLDPAELGQVQVRITHSGGATPPLVEIAVERPATLHLLVQDREHLDQALDRAGIPAEGRVVQFSLAPPQATPDPTPTQTASSPQGAQQGAQQDTSRQSQGQPQDQPQHGSQHQAAYRSRGGPAFDGSSFPSWGRTARAGIDITA